MREYDVAVAGAGPAGAAVAALAARAGLRTLLIDQVDEGRHKIGESLPEAGAQLLRRLGLPAPSAGGAHERITGVRSVWGVEDVLRDALNDPGGGGWRLDRRRFDRDLRSAARQSGVELLPDMVADIACGGDGWRVETRDCGGVAAATVVDATGRRASLARRLGATQRADEPLVAAWAVGDPQPAPYDTRTLIETAPDGWWYGAVLPGGAPLAAFHCAPPVAADLARQPARWRDSLAGTRALAPSLAPALFAASPIRRADARGLALDKACGKGWFACGDAALSFNPLVAQGLFNALATAGMVARLLRATDPEAARNSYQSQIDAVRASYLAQLGDLERRRVAGA